MEKESAVNIAREVVKVTKTSIKGPCMGLYRCPGPQCYMRHEVISRPLSNRSLSRECSHCGRNLILLYEYIIVDGEKFIL